MEKTFLTQIFANQTQIAADYSTGIEIGAASIKMLRLKKAAQGGYEVFKRAYLPLNNEGDHSAQIKNSLSSLIKDNQIRGSIVTSLPLSKIQSFSFVFPNMPEKDIGQAVLWKLKQSLGAGLSADKISFDYLWSLAGGEILALVFAVEKEAVMERISLFKQFSLKVAAVEPQPYAVLRALHFLKKISPQETILVLSLGSRESSISVAHQGILCLVRPLAISGSGLTEAIANYHKMAPLEAEAVKRNEGLKGAGSLCSLALSSHLEGLVVDIEHTFKYFWRQLRKSQGPSVYGRVILCGGPAALKGLDKFLAERLAVPAEVFNPLDEAQENAHSFAAALGMAARGICDNKTRQINLVPGELLKEPPLKKAAELFNRNKKLRNIFVIIAAALFIAFIQMLAISALSLNLKIYNHRIQQAKVKLNRLQSQEMDFQKQKEQLFKEEGIKEEKLGQLLSTSSESRGYSELLEFIAGLAPQELWIRQLSVVDSQIDISGMTLNPQLIIEFMNRLDASGAFRGSFFSSSEKQLLNNHTVYDFQISTTPIWEALKGK